jgi:hypothetical protein
MICHSPHAHGSRVVATTIAALIALLLSPDPRSQDRGDGATMVGVQLAQGILVEPDLRALEPPSIADENDDAGDGEGDDSGEYVPPSLERRGPEVIERRLPAPEALPQEIERQGARQNELERDGGRQQDLETPEGPGIKY